MHDVTSRRHVAAIALCAGVLLLSVLSVALPVSHAPEAAMIPEHAAEMTLVDTTRQRRAHHVLLLASAAVIALLASRRTAQRLTAMVPPAGRLTTAAGGLLCTVFALAIVAIPMTSKTAVAGFALTGLAVVLGARAGRARWLSLLSAAALVCYAALVLLPGLLKVPDLVGAGAPPPGIAEAHYNLVISPGDRLAQGYRLFSNFIPNYGLLFPEMLGAVEHSVGLLTFGGHIRLVQVVQVLFCLAAFGGYWIWSGRSWLTTALVLIPILAFAHTRHRAVFLPNQAGWRLLGLPLGMLILVLVRKKGVSAAPALGLALGGLLFLNPETGIVDGAAYFTFITTAQLRVGGGVRRLASPLLRFAASAVVLPVIFGVVFRSAFGYLPLPPRGQDLALARFAAGYGGLRLFFDISWVVILVHSVFELIRGALSLESLDSRRQVRMSVAAAILIWFAYFANRAHVWNLWTFYFLYGFLLVDLLRPARLARDLRALRRWRLPLSLAVLGMYVSINMPNVALAARENLYDLKHGPSEPVALLSGAQLPAWYANLARDRADLVRQKSKLGPVSYVTANAYLVPILSGTFSRLPVGDAYEGYVASDFDRLVAWFEKTRPPEILFDDVNTPLVGSPERRHYFERLKQALTSTYAVASRQAGWEVWRLSAAPPGP
jgi:hypothetical protein